MSFVKSLFLGNAGSYTIFGVPVTFKEKVSEQNSLPSLEGDGVISKLAYWCMRNRPFRLMTQVYIHDFVHEMSHTLAHRLLLSQREIRNQKAKITIFTETADAYTELPIPADVLKWKRTIIDLSGPMGNIVFSTCKLVAATALRRFLSWPVSLYLGMGAITQISGELLYAVVSGSKKDNGDFGYIAQRGKLHLALASAALVAQAALGVFAAIKLA